MVSIFGRREQRELRRRNAELERQVEWLTSENEALAEEVEPLVAEVSRLGNRLEGAYLRAERAEAALAERDELLAMLELGGVRIVSDGGAFTLAEFRKGISNLNPRAEEGSE